MSGLTADVLWRNNITLKHLVTRGSNISGHLTGDKFEIKSKDKFEIISLKT